VENLAAQITLAKQTLIAKFGESKTNEAVAKATFVFESIANETNMTFAETVLFALRAKNNPTEHLVFLACLGQ